MSKAEKILVRLWVEFQEKERYLFDNDLAERCISFNFAKNLSMAEEFKNYNVDCEYNRNLDKVKRLHHVKEYVKNYRRNNCELTDNEEKYGITVSPDIIIHRRGEDSNYIVIELKKYSSDMNDEEFDYEKLVGYKKDLKYEYGFFIKFNKKIACIGEIDNIKRSMK